MESSKEKGGKTVKNTTLGMMIASLRKEKGMTQLELAEKMGVTDKAVSKWERDLSCPDVSTIPKLAELFGVSVDELMQVKTEPKTNAEIKDSGKLEDVMKKLKRFQQELIKDDFEAQCLACTNRGDLKYVIGNIASQLMTIKRKLEK